MKCISFLTGLVLCHMTSFAQVGIGTTTPNSKSLLDLSSTTRGLLVPRMTGADKTNMALSADDAGMMIFQTDISSQTPKGLYTFDGTGWVIPVANGTSNGQTLRWDGSKWVASSNLFNQGSSIGIGTLSPNVQLQIHSNSASSTRIQLTSGTNNGLASDGLLIGVTLANNYAHLIQQENKPLWFGTDGIERVRIDSAGNVGINKTNPTATLDVNGNAIVTSLNVNGISTLGSNGTALNSIIRASIMIDIPTMAADTEFTCTVQIPNVMEGGSVLISPSQSLAGIMIGYARVSSPGNVEIKFMNMATTTEDPANTMFYITVIQ